MSTVCRWHEDLLGRCPEPIAFPGVREAPELCVRHLAVLEPWIAARARRPADAEAWIRWAARKAADHEGDLLAVGAIRPSRAISNGR